MTKARILHRDISVGNLLIRLSIVKGEDGKYRVVWTGILTDWELSKPISEDGREIARQPYRTVGFRFPPFLSPIV